MSSPTPMEVDARALGVWSDPVTFEVTQENIAAYAEATNDPIPAHLDGSVAPPVFGIVPVFETMLDPVLTVLPIEAVPRIVHGEHDFHIARPLSPGDTVVSRSRVTGVEPLQKGSRAAIEIECRDETGELVNRQWAIIFVRGLIAEETLGTQAPEHRFDPALRDCEPDAQFTAHCDDDQTFRYAEASGDPMPIHLDEDTAKDAGLPGIIAHGMCTMAFASWGLLTNLDLPEGARLTRLAVRFSNYVRPGDDLSTSAWSLSSDATTDPQPEHAIAFTMTRPDGSFALTDGLAVFA